MKMLILFVFILVLPFAGADGLYSSNYLNLSVFIGSSLYIEPDNEDFKIEHININLGFVPMQTNSQKTHLLTTDPGAEDLNGSKLFRWEQLRTRRVSFGLEAFLTSNYDFVKIDEKESFPINNLEDDVLDYLDETDTIDINRGIENIAHNLSDGEDDLFRVIHNFADWIDENLEYDLSATPRGGTHRASWVLDNKAGVCGEFTNLFISFCRAVGIPARFVSGIAYSTDPRMPEEWGPHAWAEVYFPEVGWVPVDVTFREVGYVNPARVVIMKDVDSRTPGTSFNWKLDNASATTNPLNINVSVENKSRAVEPLLNLDSSVSYKEVSFGSYNVLNVNIRNKNDFYVPAELRISKSQEVEIFDDRRRLILMGPESEKNLYFLFKVGEDFQKDYKYNLRMGATTKRNASGFVSFTVGDEFSYYSKERASDYIEDRRKESTKEYSRSV
ncbi:MAG: transglutaminase-like domain-containing protein, partial [Nanoarchaeota archaeon]